VKQFVILSAGRSATSLVAQCLHEGGVFMGETLNKRGSQHNPHGLWEDREFRALDYAILRAAGGTGSDPGQKPPPHEDILAVCDPMAEKVKALIAKREEAHDLWGWKRPHTSLTAPVYHPHLSDPHYIAIFRSPRKQAASAKRLMRYTDEEAFAIQRIFNERILRFLWQLADLGPMTDKED
jgi:hypothetical protein